MAVDPTRVPLQTFLAVTDAGVSIDLGLIFGALYLRNTGAETLWFTLGAGAAAPVAPVASDGAGRTQLATRECLNLDDIACRFISARTAAGLAAGLTIVAVLRPGNSGYGAT